MVEILAGTFALVIDNNAGFPAYGEGPVRGVELDVFHIKRYAVTNRVFLATARDMGYSWFTIQRLQQRYTRVRRSPDIFAI